MKPIVDGIEKEYKGRLIVLRLDMQSQAGAALAPIYDLQFTPTFIFFDAQGKEIWRNVGQLDVNQLRNSLK